MKGNDICQKRGVTCEHKYVSFAQRKQMEHYSLLFDTLLLLLLLLLFITIILIYIYMLLFVLLTLSCQHVQFKIMLLKGLTV